MFHQVWAALLYLYGLLFNSMNQCPEHSQLMTLGMDDKEVRTEGKPIMEAESLRLVGSSGGKHAG